MVVSWGWQRGGMGGRRGEGLSAQSRRQEDQRETLKENQLGGNRNTGGSVGLAAPELNL